MGGLSKKAYQLDKIRRTAETPSLLLDGGNLLFKSPFLSAKQRQQAEITATGIVKAYNLMGYDAVGVAENDLAAGLDFLEKMAGRADFTWLSANLIKKSTGRPVFTPFIIRPAGAFKVGIIGLTNSAPNLPAALASEVEIRPWQEILPGLIDQLKETCDFIVLLSNHSLEKNRQIGRRFGDIHLIIQAVGRSTNLEPEQVNNTLICQTGKQGKFLGRLLINWQKSKTWGHDGLLKNLRQKKGELDGIRGRLTRYRSRSSATELSRNRVYQALQDKQALLLGDIEGLEAEAAQRADQGETPASRTNTFISLKTAMEDEPQVLKIVREIKDQIRETNRKAAGSRPEQQGGLAGWRACRSCHPVQTKTWQQTVHAGSYDTLVKEGQEFNLNCLGCHLTTEQDGNGPAAALNLNPPEPLRAVGCEVCHGPGLNHIKNPVTRTILRTPEEKICLTCHTPERDETFDYAIDRRLIDHQ